MRLARSGLLVMAVTIVLVLAGCSGDLRGDVFVTMKSGDVKRAAGIDIVLVAASPTFETAWTEAVTAFEQAYGEALALNDERIRLARLGPSTSPKWDEALEAARQADEILQTYRDHAFKLLRWGQAQSTRTDVAGRYHFGGVKRGKYYLFAHYRVFDNDVYWMVPVQVSSRSQSVDLTVTNAGWGFLPKPGSDHARIGSQQ